MPARRAAAVLTATVLTAGPAILLGAVPAHAAGDSGEGKAGAAVLRTGLNVELLNGAAKLPLNVSLNEVNAPKSAEEKTLSVTLDGVEGGKPVNVLAADVATARATVDKQKAEGHSNLVKARLHVPGLPLLSLIEVEQVTSKATCEVGKKPAAESNVLGSVTVLGKKTTLTAGGTTKVEVPGVGRVQLDLSQKATTNRTAAATALELNVSVDPLKAGVAKVDGRVKLAEANCETPAPADDEQPPSSDEPEEPGTQPQGEDGNLAETGGSSATPYIAGGAAALIAAGGGAMLLARKRRAARSEG
ncbi:SCO1860 family LAETG-anchored protein [Streptomyces pathocidini]|uniref:SCO1860 family LAETG-anchored protein n=1 Tax=Streptomyces pathocidini TaxID=1650571 RepID=UPI0033D41BE5